MQLVKNRVPRYPGRVTLAPVSGNVYDMTRADQPTQAGTSVNAELLNAIYGFDNVKTVFNSNGSITQSDSSTGAQIVTVFNSNGSITETFSQGGTSLVKTTTFGSDGSITESLG